MAAQQTSVSTTLTRGFPGLVTDSSGDLPRSMVSEETSAEMPFGQMVKQGTGDRGCLRLTASADSAKMVGIVAFRQAFSKDAELGTSGLKPKITIPVKARGRILVLVDENVTPASPVRVRCTDTGGVAGTFRTSASAGNTILISAWARFLTTTSATGFAELEFDVSNRNSSTAD